MLSHLSILSVSLLMVACGGQIHEAMPVLIDREVIDPVIETLLMEMEKEEHFSGVALVMKKQEVVHAKGYGQTND